MKKLLLTAAFAALFATPVLAQVGDATANNPTRGAKGAEHIRPGSVGPGSENNAHVSPTAPSVPTYAQPPSEIPADSGASGSSTGESGSTGPAPRPRHGSGRL